ncbi:hypothetical protein [Streptomyces sp. Ru72]|uniref:hypothetical protein n=1 Tax=Streptomyces sp. Ru72 TaxID=2080747 RepID=UPI0026A5D025
MTPRSGQRTAVVGVALSDCGRVDDATPYALHAQAARRALADAGLDRALVDGFASAGLGTLAPAEVAEYLGLRPTWVDSTSVGGSTWEVMAAHAADAIAAGRAKAVLLVYGSTARADLRAGRRTGTLSFGARGPLQFEVPYGHTLIAKYAMAARRHMHAHGTTIEQLAEVAVQARANAAANPEAVFRDPITVEDVLAGPVIADPSPSSTAAYAPTAGRRSCWWPRTWYGTAVRGRCGCWGPESTSRTRRCPSGRTSRCPRRR